MVDFPPIPIASKSIAILTVSLQGCCIEIICQSSHVQYLLDFAEDLYFEHQNNSIIKFYFQGYPLAIIVYRIFYPTSIPRHGSLTLFLPLSHSFSLFSSLINWERDSRVYSHPTYICQQRSLSVQWWVRNPKLQTHPIHRWRRTYLFSSETFVR